MNDKPNSVSERDVTEVKAKWFRRWRTASRIDLVVCVVVLLASLVLWLFFGWWWLVIPGGVALVGIPVDLLVIRRCDRRLSEELAASRPVADQSRCGCGQRWCSAGS